ncbi:MAG TPA: hypothetical protein VD837_09010 [Terriglobales bacterium]|nr:hypothetical protein [Terriglobales bacterium]
MLAQKRQLLKQAAAILIGVSILSGVLFAQSRRKQKGPRAVGVIEINAAGRARLVPVGILIDGKWYDAGIYMANPRPMALEPGTVYEGEKAGTPAGLFTVTGVQQARNNWIGVGSWEVKKNEQAAPKQAATSKPENAYPEDDDAPPVLRRPGSAKNETSKPDASPSASPTPAPSQSGSATPEQKPAGDQSTTATVRAPEAAEDPNRPVLRRGKPEQEASGEFDLTGSAKSGDSKPGAVSTPTPIFTETLVAISDANLSEPRSFAISLNPQEREEHTRKMMLLASEAIRKFAVTHPIRGRQAPAVTLADMQVRDFDINGSNDPVLVLSARAPETPTITPPAKAAAPAKQPATTKLSAQAAQEAVPVQQPAPPPPGAGFEYYVTVVARVDVNGEVRKLFEWVTDNSHLDAIPRLQLVDCVDADGNRVGELLFRQTYDRGRSYVIYRVGMDTLWEVFESTQVGF